MLCSVVVSLVTQIWYLYRVEIILWPIFKFDTNVFASTHRVVFGIFTEHFRCYPPLGARNTRPPAETVSACSQLLTQAKVRDHGTNTSMGIRHRNQDVVWLQVSVNFRITKDEFEGSKT